MFGSKKSTDECYKMNEHSNIVTFVRALIYISIDYDSSEWLFLKGKYSHTKGLYSTLTPEHLTLLLSCAVRR